MIVDCQRPPVRPGRRPPRPHPQAGDRPEQLEAGVAVAGRYRLTELVGHGATARVWRARDELLDRDVAVKWFREPHSHGVAEARLAARVRHPNVAAVHDIVPHGGSHCLVMDYHGRATLAGRLRHGRRLPPPVVAGVGLQLLAALRAVHAAGIVHCDVKPANLLLGDDGRLVLIDFGIAETVGEPTHHPARRDGEIVGSPAYIAPEVLRSQPFRPAADLWSLGATLYAAVEGHPPFPQPDAAQILAAVLLDPPPLARSAGPLQPLLARLLVKDPDGRPSHDAIQAQLNDAYPASPTPILAHERSGAGDLQTAERTTTAAVPSAAGWSLNTMPFGAFSFPAPPAA
jgi:serine/threonine protein kinase